MHPMASMDKSRNMYGHTRCPECGGHYRCSFNDRPGIVQCDDCGHEEPANEDNSTHFTE